MALALVPAVPRGRLAAHAQRFPMKRSLRSLVAFAGAAGLSVFVAGCHEDVPVAPVVDVIPPAPPQALYSVTGDGRVDLFWVRNTEPDFREYIVWRGPKYEGPYDRIGNTNAPAFVDPGAVNGQTYYYAVSAVDQAGNESDLSKEVVFDTPRPEGFGLTVVNAAADPQGPSGYDFSAGVRRLSTDPRTDVYYTIEGGVR